MSRPRLQDLCDVVDCEHKTAPEAAPGSEYAYSVGTPALRGSNIDFSQAKRVDRATYEAWSRRAELKAGDIVLAREAPVGGAGYVDGSKRVCLGQRTVLVRATSTDLDSRFLFFALQSPAVQEWMGGRSSGSTVAHLNVADVRELPLPFLPPLYEQRRIAGVLGALDDLIETNQRLISQIEDLLSALFADCGFDRQGETSLRDLVQINPSYPKPKGEAAYVDMAALSETRSGIDRVQRRLASGGARFMNGDTLMARITPCLENGKTGFVDGLDDGEVGIGSTEFIVLRPNQGIHQIWPYFLARSDRFRDYVIRHMSGTSGRQRCSADSVGAYTLESPDPADMSRFATTANPMMLALRDLRDEYQQAAVTRDELLPLLLSGRVSVREVAA